MPVILHKMHPAGGANLYARFVPQASHIWLVYIYTAVAWSPSAQNPLRMFPFRSHHKMLALLSRCARFHAAGNQSRWMRAEACIRTSALTMLPGACGNACLRLPRQHLLQKLLQLRKLQIHPSRTARLLQRCCQATRSDKSRRGRLRVRQLGVPDPLLHGDLAAEALPPLPSRSKPVCTEEADRQQPRAPECPVQDLTSQPLPCKVGTDLSKLTR